MDSSILSVWFKLKAGSFFKTTGCQVIRCLDWTKHTADQALDGSESGKQKVKVSRIEQKMWFKNQQLTRTYGVSPNVAEFELRKIAED